MADFFTDQGIRLDGRINSLSEVEQTAAPATADRSRLRIFVSGDGVLDPGAMGLD